MKRPMYLSEPGRSPLRTAEHIANQIEYDLDATGRWVVIDVGRVVVFRECGHPAGSKTGRRRCFDCKGTGEDR